MAESVLYGVLLIVFIVVAGHCLPGRDTDERDTVCDKERPVDPADGCSGIHPHLPFLHCWLCLLQGRLHD